MYDNQITTNQPKMKPAWGMIPLAAYVLFYFIDRVIFAIGGNILPQILYILLTIVAGGFLIALLFQKKRTELLCIPFVIFAFRTIVTIILNMISLISVLTFSSISHFYSVILTIVFSSISSLIPFAFALVMAASAYISCKGRFADKKKIVDIAFYILLGINALILLISMGTNVISLITQLKQLRYMSSEAHSLISLLMKLRYMSSEAQRIMVTNIIGNLMGVFFVEPLYLVSMFLIKRWIDNPYEK